MDKRKKKIIIALIIALIILTFGEIVIRAIVNKVNKVIEENEERKQAEIVYNSDEQVTKRQIITFLNDVFSAINSEKYDFIYSSLESSYRKYMFNDDINKLKEYIKKNIEIGDKFEYPRIIENNGLYQVIVSITNGDRLYSKEITVLVMGKNDCRMMFGTYNSFKELMKKWNSENMDYTLSYAYETPELHAFVIDIKNKTDKDISIDFSKEPELISSNGKVIKGAKMKTILVKPSEGIRTECIFKNEGVGQSDLKLYLTENNEKNEIIFTFED